MIQDIGQRRFDNAFITKAPAARDNFLYYEQSQILLIQTDDGYVFPSFSMIDEQRWAHAAYAFSIDDEAFYLLQSAPGTLSAPSVLYTVQQLRDFQPPWMGFAGATGWQLRRWMDNHKFCSRCAGNMVPGEKERVLLCCACGASVYPKILPAVIVAVSDGDNLLMVKPKNATTDRYHLVAGFVEIGETMEQAVAREVMEETGIAIKNIRYYKNQPWSFSDTLMVGFTAELDGDATLTPQLSEVSDARWFHRHEVPRYTSTASIGSELTNRFHQGDAR